MAGGKLQERKPEEATPEDSAPAPWLRPERANLPLEEALRRMQEFADKRQEKMIAAVRTCSPIIGG